MVISPLQKAGEGGGEEDKVREQLEEAAQAGEELRREVDRLNTSLDQAAQLRTQAEDSVHEVYTHTHTTSRQLRSTHIFSCASDTHTEFDG